MLARHQLHLHPQAISIDHCLDLYVTLPRPKEVCDIRGAVSQSLITMFCLAIRMFLEKASKPDTSFVQYKAKEATAKPNAVWDRMYIFPGPLHCTAQEMKDVMYHSLCLLTGKTAVYDAKTKFMTNNVTRTTNFNQELHNYTVKDITALARGNTPTISGISKVVVNRLRRQREGEPDREQDHYEPDVSDPQ